MEVKRINLNGDLGVVNAARVSFGKWKTKIDDKDIKLIDYLKLNKHKSPFFHSQVCFTQKYFDLNNFSKTDIAGLEWYHGENKITFLRASLFLYDKHKKIFTQGYGLDNNTIIYNESWLLEQKDLFRASRLPYLQFRIKAPIFVVRQLEKHTIGFAKNERSLRYTTFEPEFWQPKKWREKSESNKQGSNQDKFIKEVQDEWDRFEYSDCIRISKEWYDINIKNGMCGEQARAILPLSTYTEFVWTASLQDYARLCSLRLQNNTQTETREVAEMIYDLCKEEYPLFDKIIEFFN